MIYVSPIIESLSESKDINLRREDFNLIPTFSLKKKTAGLKPWKCSHVGKPSWIIHPLLDTRNATLKTNQESI